MRSSSRTINPINAGHHIREFMLGSAGGRSIRRRMKTATGIETDGLSHRAQFRAGDVVVKAGSFVRPSPE